MEQLMRETLRFLRTTPPKPEEPEEVRREKSIQTYLDEMTIEHKISNHRLYKLLENIEGHARAIKNYIENNPDHNLVQNLKEDIKKIIDLTMKKEYAPLKEEEHENTGS